MKQNETSSAPVAVFGPRILLGRAERRKDERNRRRKGFGKHGQYAYKK